MPRQPTVALGSSVLIVRLVRRHAASSRHSAKAGGVSSIGVAGVFGIDNSNSGDNNNNNQVRKHSVNQLKATVATALDSAAPSQQSSDETSSTQAGSPVEPRPSQQQQQQVDEAIYRIPVGRGGAAGVGVGAIRRLTDQQMNYQQQQHQYYQQQGFHAKQASLLLGQQRTVGTILNYDHQARPTTFGAASQPTVKSPNRPIDC